MAWRIRDSVVRGTISNIEKGRVTGFLEVAGLGEVTLDLEGNCHPDMAGCKLTFHNTGEIVASPHEGFKPLQYGKAGDITAARKVRVFDVPLEEALLIARRGEKPPGHIANGLYIEWYSSSNGRVVIELSDTIEVTITEPSWRLDADVLARQSGQSEDAMRVFLDTLSAVVEEQEAKEKHPEEEWDEHDYEQMFRTNDARTDKFGELLDKYGHDAFSEQSDEAHEQIAREMGWEREEGDGETWREQEVPDLSAYEIPEPDPAMEGISWMRTERGEIRHPLQHRCHESAIAFRKSCERLLDDNDVAKATFEFLTTSAKLAGALNALARSECPPEPPFTVAACKRALNHLHASIDGLEAVSKRDLLPRDLIDETRVEMHIIRSGVVDLMNELRRR